MDCIFCQIRDKKLPAKILYETDDILAFPDINPSADIHIIIVPKKHIGGVQDLTDADGMLLAEIYKASSKLISENNLQEDLYRIVVNGGKAQHVPHLHFHLLGGNLKKMV